MRHVQSLEQLADAVGLELEYALGVAALQELVGVGIVERQESPDDRRVKLISLSPTGFEVADQEIEAKRRAVRRFVERLSPTEAENLTQALRPILAGDSLRTSTKDHHVFSSSKS